jgi:hypothetical protein
VSLAGHGVILDEPNLVGMSGSAGTNPKISAIGATLGEQPGVGGPTDELRWQKAIDRTAFDPELSSSVAQALTLAAWSRRHPGLGGVGAALDRLSVAVLIKDYDAIPAMARSRFESSFAHHPQITWSFGDLEQEASAE